MRSQHLLSSVRLFGALAAAASIAACSDTNSINDPAVNGTAFSRQISVQQLQQALQAAPARVEIELIPANLETGPWVAREVEIKTADEMGDEEEIESRVTDLEVNGRSGTVVLELGGLRVDFDENSTFKAEGSDKLTFDEFVDRLQTKLLTGKPAIEVERNATAAPQDPNDATFFATELKLDDEDDEPEIEINVDADNYAENAAPPPDGWITVLDLMIEIRASTGETELEEENDDVDGEWEFEGLVESVDPTNNTVTLMGGTIVRIIENATKIEEADDDDELGSLQAVQQALDNDQLVEAEGEGIVVSSDPLTIDAIEIEFELEDEDDDLPGTVEFEGLVSVVNATDEFFTLADGTKVWTNQATIDTDGDLLDIQAVATAVANQKKVKAEGRATVIAAGPPAELRALKVEFEVQD